MKVLIVLYYYHPYVSGVSVCAKRVAEGLVERGYEVTVLTSMHERGLAKEETINGVHVVRRPVLLRLGKGVIMPTFWLDIIRYAKRNDYVNAHLPMAESGLAAIFIPKSKSITTYQCDINLGDGPISRLVAFISMALMRLQLRRSRVIIPSTRDYFSHSVMKAFSSKIVPIYPTVTEDEFHPIESAKLFAKLGVAKDVTKIGFVGRVVYEKGIDYLLGTIPYLKKELGEFKIIIVGDYDKVAGGSTKAQLDSYIQRYPESIIFTGYLGDVERNQFYSGIDLLVLPSIDPLEAFGMVQIEAMLCGAPVVASDLPGVREIVKRSGYGRISRLRDSKDIAKQIVTVVKNPGDYRPDRGRVVSLFDPTTTIDAYAKLMPTD